MVAVCLTIASAQSDQSPNDYHRNEFYVGYSNNQIDGGGRSGLHGIEGSYTRSVSRYFGFRADVSYAQRSRQLTGQLINPGTGLPYTFIQDSTASVTNVLAGVQIKDNSTEKRFKPFAFAMAGIAHNRGSFRNFACASGSCPTNPPGIPNFSSSDTGFAAALGGGLDIKLSRKFDLRVIQVDYNPIYSDQRVDNNFRIGFGVVFH